MGVLDIVQVNGENQVVDRHKDEVLTNIHGHLPSYLPTEVAFTQQDAVTYDSSSSWSTPEVGSIECPTVGSWQHHLGNCRPCAFLYTKGCTNGASCEFCHLCDQAERKRRTK